MAPLGRRWRSDGLFVSVLLLALALAGSVRAQGLSGWASEVVDSLGRAGWASSLVLDAAGRPHVAYYEASGQTHKYAWREVSALAPGAGPASRPGQAWQIQVVDSVGDVGQYASLALDAAGRPHVSYYDATRGDLKYAYYCSGAAGVDCAGQDQAWQIETVDSGGDVGSDTALALDAAGRPHVSYHDRDREDLKYAYRVTAAPLPEAGGEPLALPWQMLVAALLIGVGVILRRWAGFSQEKAWKGPDLPTGESL